MRKLHRKKTLLQFAPAATVAVSSFEEEEEEEDADADADAGAEAGADATARRPAVATHSSTICGKLTPSCFRRLQVLACMKTKTRHGIYGYLLVHSSFSAVNLTNPQNEQRAQRRVPHSLSEELTVVLSGKLVFLESRKLPRL